MNQEQQQQLDALQLGQVQQKKIQQYLELLNEWNHAYNLTACRPNEQMSLLVIPSLLCAPLLATHARMLDLGTGAGIPGVPLAILSPQQQWILVEKVAKKVNFLQWVIHELKLENVGVLAENFKQIPVDPTVGGIISRGSSQLSAQINMTQSWRAQGSVLYSMQTTQSHREADIKELHQQHVLTDEHSQKKWLLIQVK